MKFLKSAVEWILSKLFPFEPGKIKDEPDKDPGYMKNVNLGMRLMKEELTAMDFEADAFHEERGDV